MKKLIIYVIALLFIKSTAVFGESLNNSEHLKSVEDKIKNHNYSENCQVGSVVDGLFTIREGDRFDIYNTEGELIKSIEKPLGFSHIWGDSKITGKTETMFRIYSISGTNVIVYTHPGDMTWEIYPDNDCFIIRLMSEKIAADDFFNINPLPNGEFYAINVSNGYAYILNKDGSPKLKTQYRQLDAFYDGEKIYFDAFESYNPSAINSSDRYDYYDIIDINGNVIEKNINSHTHKNSDGVETYTSHDGEVFENLKNIGLGWYTFVRNGKIGIINNYNHTNVVQDAIYNSNCKIGTVPGAVVTIQNHNKYNSYNDRGELYHTVEKPAGFDIDKGINGKLYDIVEISDTNVVFKERSNKTGEYPTQNWFILRLVNEKITSENFFKIHSNPDDFGFFTAIDKEDMKACLLNMDGSLRLKTNYGELLHYKAGLFAAFKNYNPNINNYEERSEKYDIIDWKGNVIEKNITD